MQFRSNRRISHCTRRRHDCWFRQVRCEVPEGQNRQKPGHGWNGRRSGKILGQVLGKQRAEKGSCEVNPVGLFCPFTY